MRGLAFVKWLGMCLVALTCLGGCAHIPEPSARLQMASALAAQHDWEALTLQTTSWPLIAFAPRHRPGVETLTVFIEGDGFAWVTPTLPSLDPTPVDPIGMRVALAHPHAAAAYLARPCQFIHAQALGCPSALWQGGRFSDAAVLVMGQGLDQLKQVFRAQRLILVGYSGGGTLAALLAGRRQDVGMLVTLAGNLDPHAWARHHALTPLADSLSPMTHLSSLSGIRQVHVVGGRDHNVPPQFAFDYAARFDAGHRPEVRVIEDADHACCWAQKWPQLWQALQVPGY